MRYRLISLALVGLLLSSTPAAAEPLTLRPRLVPGDAVHYTEGVHTTLSSAQMSGTIDYTIGAQLAVEDVVDDGSAIIRETIDQFDVAGDLADMVDSIPLGGVQFTFTMHPDGSTSDIQMVGGDELKLTTVSGGQAFSPVVPTAGISVGQSYDANEALPIPFSGGQPPRAAVHTTLDALVTESDRPAARLIQTLKMPELEVPFGPFGAAGRVRMSAEGQTIYLMALDTGWPLKIDGVTALQVSLTAEGTPQAVAERMEMHVYMDDQALVDQ